MGKVARLRRLTEGAHAIEPDGSLVLSAPQHYHVTLICYEGLADDGRTFLWSTELELVGNDVTLVENRARALTRRRESHLRLVRQCAEPTHLEGLSG